MNEKLTKIGHELNISENDINSLKTRSKSKKSWVKKVIYIVVGAVIAALTYILGYFWLTGKNLFQQEQGGYPFSLNPIFLGFLLPKSKKAKIIGLLAGIIVFLTAIKIKYALGQINNNVLYQSDLDLMNSGSYYDVFSTNQ